MVEDILTQNKDCLKDKKVFLKLFKNCNIRMRRQSN